MPQYSDKVMDHFRNPRNVGEIENPDGIGYVGNPVCVTQETLVLANNKIAQISNLMEGEKVLSHDGNYHKIIKILSRDYKGPIYSITPRNLGSFQITPDHNILALILHKFDHKYRNYKRFIPDWLSACELKKGDVLLYPIPKEIKDIDCIPLKIKRSKWDFKSKPLPKKIKISDDFLILIGYYLAEGFVRTDKNKGTIGFVFGSKEENYVNEVKCIMERVFSLTPAKIRRRHNSINIEFYSASLARFFSETFGKGALNKKMPHWMTLLHLEKIENVLRGTWRGDGYINNKQAKFVTISQTLAYQIRSVLLREKIIFSFLTVAPKGMHKQNYCIYVKEKDSLLKLAKIVGKEIHAKDRIKYPKKSWYDDDFYYVPIRKIAISDFKGTVYNLEVEDPHSYVSNAATLHNCGDIMELYIKVKDNIIEDVKFKTFGCGAAIATSSMITELVKGKTIEEALQISNRAVVEALEGLPPVKLHCSVLAEDALKSAIDNYLRKTTGKGIPGFKPHEDNPPQ